MASGDDSCIEGKQVQSRPAGAGVVGKLSSGQAKFQRQGFYGPILGLTREETEAALQGFKRCVEARGSQSYSMLHASHPWLCGLAKHPWILDAVAVVLQSSGIYLISSHLFAREPGQSLQSATGLDWHRDGEQYLKRLCPVDSTHFVTAFLALSKCDRDHGCLSARPLCGGDEVDLELQPGQFSLHGPFTEHTGKRNLSGEVRYCVALRYVAAGTRCLDEGTPAMLVRGSDPAGHFEQIPEPVSEHDASGIQRRNAILRKWAQSSWDYMQLPADADVGALEEGTLRRTGRVSQLWEVVCTRVAVREAPRPGAEAIGDLVHGDLFFVAFVHGDWVCIDRRGQETTEGGAQLPQQWVLTERRRPTPLKLVQRVW